MAEQLKIVIDADVSKAVAGIKDVSKVIAVDFSKATNIASAAAFDLNKSVADAAARIDKSIDKMVEDALKGSTELKNAFGNIGSLNISGSNITPFLNELKQKLDTLDTNVIIKTFGIDKLNADIAEAKAQLNTLVGKQLIINVDATKALQQINVLEAELADLQKLSLAPNISSTQFELFQRNIEALKLRINELKTGVVVPLRLDNKQIIQSISQVQTRLNKIGDGARINTSGFSKFQDALAKSTVAISNLEKRGAGLNNFFARVNTASSQAASSLSKIPNASNQATQSLTNLGRVVQDAPFGFIGIANNLNPLVESFQRLKATTGTTGGALKALGSSLLGPGGIGIAISVVSSLLVVFGDRLFKTGKSADEAEDKVKTLNDTLKGIRDSVSKEAADTAGLIGILKNETETRERKIAALKELKQIQPEIFGQLQLEGNTVAGLDKAYQAYLQQLRLVITAKLKQAQLEQITNKILEKEGLILTKSQKESLKVIQDITKDLNKQGDLALKTGELGALGAQLFRKESDKQAASTKELNDLYEDQTQLITEITELSKGIEVKIDTSGAKAAMDDLVELARRFAKQFGDTFVVPDLELSFTNTKEIIEKAAVKLIKDFRDGNLKIKLPVEAIPDVEFKEFEVPQSVIDNFFKGVKTERNIPIEITIDPSLSKESINKINQKLDLRKQFEIFGDFGLKEFDKIFKGIDSTDFGGLNNGIEEATRLLNGMLQVATTLQQALAQGVTNAFNSVFDAILDGKDVFKVLANAIKELIVGVVKAIAQMLILKAVTSLIFGGATGGASLLGRSILGSAIGGTANPFGLGGQIGQRSFSNVLNVVVQGRLSGQDILLSGQRTGNSIIR